MAEHKLCSRCDTQKPMEQFSRKGNGYNSHCKPCKNAYLRKWYQKNKTAQARKHAERRKANRAATSRTNHKHQLKKKYGITPEDYNELLSRQGNACAICRREQLSRRLAVDHEHSTGRIRGLLCSRCNLAIGLLEDNPQSLASAIEYLQLSVPFTVPAQFEMGGITYKVMRETLPEDTLGECDYANAKIVLSDSLNAAVELEVFFHELIEAANAGYSLGLPHAKIEVLGAAIAQAIKSARY